jgi:hypothetical protein
MCKLNDWGLNWHLENVNLTQTNYIYDAGVAGAECALKLQETKTTM